MKKLKWGIVSSGRISHKFCSDLIQFPDAEIQAVAARNLDRAQTFAEQFSIKKAYQGYQALFADPEVDIVYIGTPHTCHYTNARDAILAGKHVLCEKPLVTAPEQCQELILLAKKHNVFLMEAMWTYFLPAITTAKEWIVSGRLGEIKHIKIDFGYQMPYSPDCREYNAELAGGSLFDVGIYPLALAWYFLEKDISNLHVFNTNAPNGVDEDVIIIADYGDVKATLASSFQCWLANSAYIVGDKGYIRIPNAFRATRCEFYQNEVCVDTFNDDRTTQGYIYEVMEAHNQINAGKIESPTISHSTSLKFQIQMAKIKSMFANS
ncbi:Gfo/Idh/MocA family protein [Thalassotalea agariperforans]